jgi:hypothetical protein
MTIKALCFNNSNRILMELWTWRRHSTCVQRFTHSLLRRLALKKLKK